ncbi:MAG: AAA family ATPase, partial [bacterium]
MKILELKFKNLNSLYGKWLIDFTTPEYTSEGIFALTGPTGSGKSTILDAICLALYGATPRLGKISISSNEIMSRNTGECFAEVLFQSQSGLFRCSWYQHRARKKTDGELQQPRHEISEADGTIIESKIRDVAMHVEEKTGMNFERFTRSMMLAQGAFDSFLKAGTEDKSRILEQITGTEIYTEISKKVHERKRLEQSELEHIKTEMAATEILEPEEKKELEKTFEDKKSELKKLHEKHTETEKALNWLKTVNKLQAEIKTLSKQSSEIGNEIEKFNPQRK